MQRPTALCPHYTAILTPTANVTAWSYFIFLELLHMFLTGRWKVCLSDKKTDDHSFNAYVHYMEQKQMTKRQLDCCKNWNFLNCLQIRYETVKL